MRIILKGESVWLALIGAYVTQREVYSKHHGVISQAKGKGGGDTSTQTIQQADPWEGQQPYLKDIFAQSQGFYNSDTPQPYGQETVAPLSRDTINAQNYLRDTATNVLPGQIASGLQANDFALNGVLDVDSNPYLAESVNKSITPITQNLTDNILPQVRSGAGNAGQYGGTRQGIAEGLAIDRTGQEISRMVSQRYSDAYDRGLDTFDKGLALLPQTLQTTLMPGTVLDSIGQQNQGYQQELMNAVTGKWDYQQNLDLNKLSAYQSLVQGNFGGSSSSSTSGGAAGPSAFSGAIGGAAAGASLASSLFTTSSMAGSVGAGIGAVLSFL